MASNDGVLIRLEEGGIAPVLSYNVPEPVAYSGRNFIDLQLPASYFVPGATSAALARSSVYVRPEAVERVLLAQAREMARAEARPPRPLTPASLAAALGVDIAPDVRLSPELAQLDLREAATRIRSGKRLNLYQSLYGELTYNYIDAVADDEGLTATTAVEYRLQPHVAGEPIPEQDPPELAIAISSPAAGATINGPSTGAAVTIAGMAQKLSGIGSVGRVDVQINAGSFQRATTTNTWANWTFPTTLTAAGAYTITARATHSGGFITEETTISVNVVLAPPPDAKAPVVAITAPSGGANIQGPSTGASVTINGTAFDSGGSGVRVVEIALDGSATYTAATPRAANDWSTWSRTVTLLPGARTITARCADNAGNITTTSITVTVSVPPPPDTTLPTLTVTSPANGATITGTFPAVTVNVTGTASDASGIARVEVSLNGNPAFVEAVPRAPGDWSTWSFALQLTSAGLNTINVRAVDKAGPTPNVSTVNVTITVNLAPEIVSRLTRLILVESYQLSSFLGVYGAGRSIRTFSLLPGEKTKISIKTFTRTETDAQNSSSILDSFTRESSRDFEQSMGNEQTNKSAYEESFNYKVGLEAKASWGWGSASISGEVSGGTNSSREQFAKNIANAVQKHAAKASAKRDIQINTSYEVKEQTGEETAIERVLENINAGRTLNFVFRQMNQEFITLLHLIDVRIGFYKVETVNGVEQRTYREYTLPQLDALINQVIQPQYQNTVRNAIIYQLSNIFDYQDIHHAFVEREQLKDRTGRPLPGTDYLRVKKDYAAVYRDASGNQISVPGIILAANKYTMRTEGIIVEALLGQGNGLDPYSLGLQGEAVRTRKLSNDQAELEAEKLRTALQIIREGNTAAAALFEQLFPPAPVQPAAVPTSSNGQLA